MKRGEMGMKRSGEGGEDLGEAIKRSFQVLRKCNGLANRNID